MHELITSLLHNDQLKNRHFEQRATKSRTNLLVFSEAKSASK